MEEDSEMMPMEGKLLVLTPAKRASEVAREMQSIIDKNWFIVAGSPGSGDYGMEMEDDMDGMHGHMEDMDGYDDYGEDSQGMVSQLH